MSNALISIPSPNARVGGQPASPGSTASAVVTDVLAYRSDRRGLVAAQVVAGGREFWVEGDGLDGIIVHPEQAA